MDRWPTEVRHEGHVAVRTLGHRAWHRPGPKAKGLAADAAEDGHADAAAQARQLVHAGHGKHVHGGEHGTVQPLVARQHHGAHPDGCGALVQSAAARQAESTLALKPLRKTWLLHP